ncbi:UDP-N-acetylmuramoyl-L-alanyl-D-glutamate--2,6-diaminopimelate ligase [Chlamydia pecorum]|uniref:UDP-N-acetylmuramoyl-L-alanyl-D-glutamate--2,6-diaminopimelate ligase n=1 Tax=Chlamydia pecorum (strain ATCC VR-628 / DSM 29919 / E58) TaxID=331635 RepID=A0AA34WI75_CHLPE|nr:UDP-N-acetylmuramoyl-L-alanyl-D-glutamate--2,6-diaminopimelate ligase [Chlamydia pecorum]AEB41667.1 UDP-N-acetylmuramoylalanyl-D-glutamate--2,6-diaminopimelate ligase [Chlamydia pecorum E58]ETF37432.1 UDP-N-acetylmuramoylalanyl-D-glutamate--2, 6-diaminopimelate ligase [Chlamydia pecorum VR629]UFP07201.1 UDP-N-acetylmuramoyl-L-alanyl-D-glutamate--2,6-diaminopimelate ligase [Chlamydia pecorum]UJT77033.1 UDP-N-acetylmuramoylalanyl-D-glutamate--2, 6-diaminopimelate ligase [Chlamydia pecorum]
MNLKELLQGISAKIYGKVPTLEVRNFTRDSRCVGVGDIFIACRGEQHDGNDFSADAVERGAIAILSSFYNPFLSIVQIVTSCVEQLEAELAAKFYGRPSEKLEVFGVTGTNGKTTVTYMIKALLDHSHKPAGLIGTIEHILGEGSIHDSFTTPSACLLQKYFAEMVKNRRKAVAMEVSSIGLELNRTAQTSFDVGILTNVTLDHLDFHGTLENYLTAKEKLFSQLPKNGCAVINADSPYASRFCSIASSRCVTYGIEEAAEYRACDLQLSLLGTRYTLVHRGKSYLCKSPLIGRYNVYNTLAAIAAVHERSNQELPELLVALENAPLPKGRLEPVFSGPCPIYIDYAHTPDALDNVLATLKELMSCQGRVIIVFGCGGDRDRSKRKLMARVAERYGFSIVTTDNPRKEDPEVIIHEICEGFTSQKYCVEQDRKKAILRAISMASDKDVVLIAGKGHETYQIFKHQTLYFSDKQVVNEVLASYV